jgi:hypothetical protein
MSIFMQIVAAHHISGMASFRFKSAGSPVMAAGARVFAH